jgi:hypothetical protein
VLGLGWYLDHFAAAAGRLKGEASPSYALLPPGRVRLIRRLMPEVKLVLLMRDPVARAWSHARHAYRFREANFAGVSVPFDAVPDEAWLAHLSSARALACGDYLGQIRRWLEVFPREQLFLGFAEDAASRPEALLREVFAFLGADASISLEKFPVRQRVLEGLPGEPSPAVRATLRRLPHAAAELVAFLKREFGLTPPPAWAATLTPPDGDGPPAPLPHHECLDALLAEEETYPSARCLAQADYRGHYVVYAWGQFHALAAELAPLRPGDADAAVFDQHARAGRYFVAPSLEAVRRLIDAHLSAQLTGRLDQAERRIASLEAPLAEGPRRLLRRLWGRAGGRTVNGAR